jgi:CRISPR-associated protein (TIGR02584 family)
VTAVTIVTTATGATAVEAALLGPTGGIVRLCRTRAPEVHVEILMHRGEALADIRNPEEHAAMATQLDRLVRGLTRDGHPALHASIAGGRKSMSAALGVAMSLHARLQDRMSHVLAAPHLESDPAFLFPDEAGSEEDAGVHLVDIPFVRLRGLLPADFRNRSAVQLLASAQRSIEDATPWVFDLEARRLMRGERMIFPPPVVCALLALLVVRGREGVEASRLDAVALAAFYRRAGATELAAGLLMRRLARDPPDGWLREQISRLRKILAQASAEGMSGLPLVVRAGTRPTSRYELRGAQILFRSIKND